MKLPTFPIGRFALQWAVFGLSAAIMVVIVSIVYATASWGSLPTVASGSGLTATAWNDLVVHVNQSVKQSSQVITVSGSNVGIGTTTPGQKLSIESTTLSRMLIQSTGIDSYASLSLKNDAREWVIQTQGPDAGKLYFYDQTAGLNRMAIDSAGNVGIGTTGPSERLDLWGGNIKVGYETISVLKSAGWTPGWYYATCSAGKFVVGGSCTSSSGTAPTNTDVTGTAFGCYLPAAYTAQDYQIKAICMNVR